MMGIGYMMARLLNWRRFFSAAATTTMLPLPLPPAAATKASTRLIKVPYSTFNQPNWPPRRTAAPSSTTSSPQSPLPPLFPGADFLHWVVVMDPNVVGLKATAEQAIDVYVKTLCTILGSEEEARKRIYSVWFARHFWFGCHVDESKVKSLRGLPGVILVFPDSYINPEAQDYGVLQADGKMQLARFQSWFPSWHQHFAVSCPKTLQILCDTVTVCRVFGSKLQNVDVQIEGLTILRIKKRH